MKKRPVLRLISFVLGSGILATLPMGCSRAADTSIEKAESPSPIVETQKSPRSTPTKSVVVPAEDPFVDETPAPPTVATVPAEKRPPAEPKAPVIEEDVVHREPNPEMLQNPPINESYMFRSKVDHNLVPDTVQYFDDAEHQGVFDAIGERAKQEYVEGALLNQTGYTTKAVKHYYEAVEKDPENLWLKNRAAQVAMQQNDFNRSEKYANEVLEADPDNYTAMLTIARTQLFRNKVEPAREWFLKVLEIKPKNIDALENLARIAYQHDRDLEKTKEYCGRILQVTSRNLNALLWHAEASALTNDVKYAADLYEQLIRYRPALIARLSDMGIRLLRENRIEDATELFRRGVAMQPQSEMVRLQWETLLQQIGGAETVMDGYKQLCDENPLDLQILELYAEYLEKTGHTTELIEHRERMLDINSRHIPSLLSLARIELGRDNMDEANKYLERVLAAGPDQASTYRDIALVYMDRGDLQRASDLLMEAATMDPHDADTLVAMAALADMSNDPNQTEKMLKRAIDVSPANEQILRLLGDFYRRTGKLYEASQLYEQVLAVTPDSIAAQLTLAMLYMELGNEGALDRLQLAAPKAVSDDFIFYSDYGALALEYGEWTRGRWALEKALEIKPDALILRQLLSNAYLHLDEPKLAETTLTDASEYLKSDPEAFEEFTFALIDVHVNSKNYDEAIRLTRQIIDNHTDDIDMRKFLIGLLQDKGDEDAVTEELNTAIKDFAVEEPVKSKMLRAAVYRHREDWDRAISILNPLLKEVEDPTEVQFHLAMTYGEKNDIRNAEKYYREIIERLDTDSDGPISRVLINAYNNLAYLFANEGIELDEAEKLALRALELKPNADYIFDTLGWIKFQQKNYREAEEYLTKAEKLALKDPEILSHLGDLYRETDRLDKARAYYKQSFQLNPELKGLKEKLDSLEQSTGTAAAPSTIE